MTGSRSMIVKSDADNGLNNDWNCHCSVLPASPSGEQTLPAKLDRVMRPDSLRLFFQCAQEVTRIHGQNGGKGVYFPGSDSRSVCAAGSSDCPGFSRYQSHVAEKEGRGKT